MCHFVLVVFSPFSIAITSLGGERINLSAFRTICACFDLSVSSSSWGLEGLRFVIVALPGLFSYLFLTYSLNKRILDYITTR